MENFYLADVPAIIWGGLLSILAALLAHLYTKKKYNVEVGEKVLDTIIKKDKYNNERYDEILQELIQANQKNDELTEKMREMSQQMFAQKEKIATLIARLNVLKATQ